MNTIQIYITVVLAIVFLILVVFAYWIGEEYTQVKKFREDNLQPLQRQYKTLQQQYNDLEIEVTKPSTFRPVYSKDVYNVVEVVSEVEVPNIHLMPTEDYIDREIAVLIGLEILKRKHFNKFRFVDNAKARFEFRLKYLVKND